MKSKTEIIEDISNVALLEILFEEKKNFNTKEKDTNAMVRQVKSIVEREVKKRDIQKDDN